MLRHSKKQMKICILAETFLCYTAQLILLVLVIQLLALAKLIKLAIIFDFIGVISCSRCLMLLA